MHLLSHFISCLDWDFFGYSWRRRALLSWMPFLAERGAFPELRKKP